MYNAAAILYQEIVASLLNISLDYNSDSLVSFEPIFPNGNGASEVGIAS